MLIRNVTKEQIERALQMTNKQYDDNITYNNFTPQKCKTTFRVTLKCKSSKGLGHKKSFTGRNLISACYHVHGNFFDNLISVNPDVVIIASGKRITKSGGNWQDYNIGNELNPLLFSQACTCRFEGKKTAEKKDNIECYQCDEKIKPNEKYIQIEIFDSPFNNESKKVYLHTDNEYISKNWSERNIGCCYDRLFDTSYNDFRYFECAKCNRIISQQCLSNGYHIYYRIINGEMICLKCYEEDLMINGISEESFKENKLSGMFFDDKELKEQGWIHEGSFFIKGDKDVEDYCQKALKQIADGNKVITEYESLSIMGNEGYISMWIKAI